MPTTSPAPRAEAAPYRPVSFGPYGATIDHRADGCVELRSPQSLEPYPECFTSHLLRWARLRPNQTFLAQRSKGSEGEWIRLNYAQTLQRVESVAQSLLNLNLSTERPLMVLSGNDLEVALLGLAAMHVGIAFAPVSPAYSLLDPAASRVAQAVKLLTPGAVFASDGERFARAIELAVPKDTPVLFTRGTVPGRHAALPFEHLQRTVSTSAVLEAHQAVGAETIAKFLFTSGSTQAPKAVINTHRMLCANQQMYAQCYPFLEETPPVLVDWLPWHHTAGGNSNFGLVLRNGGSMYIDEGKPTPDGIDETLRNLREIAPTAIYTVPKGLEVLTHHMARDEVLRKKVFSQLQLVFAAGAAMPQSVIDLFDRLATETTGFRVPMTMGLGMTETAPFAVSHHRPGWAQGVIGLPAPGLELKLVPVGDKMEVRYRGPSVTPGYWRQPELHEESFDEDGYFCSGDAASFIDESDPQRGLRFDGRIAEDFKLISGTWVNVAAVRAKAMGSALPYVQDVVLTGDGRDELCLMVFLAPAAHELAPELDMSASLSLLAGHPKVRAWAQSWLNALAAAGTGGSNRVVRAMLMEAPAASGSGELTDKGSLNQRTVLKNRADLVEALYAAQSDPRTIVAQTAKP